MSQTLSFSMGRVAPLHDVRLEVSDNVDLNLTEKNNIIFIDKLADFGYDIEAYTNDKFQPVLDEYNEKQSRDDRKKKKPYCYYLEEENRKLIETAGRYKEQGINKTVKKPTRLAYEFVIQVGDHESNGIANPDTNVDLNRQYAEEVLEGLQEKYPHMDIMLATFHGDEPQGTPHLHILCQFTGEGYKQGLSRQVSVSKALENDGIERTANRKEAPFALSRFTEHVKDTIMTEKLHSLFHEDREIIGDKRAHEELPFFRAKAKEEAKALEELRENVTEAQKKGFKKGLQMGFNAACEEVTKIAVEMAKKASDELTEALDTVSNIKASNEDLSSELEQKIDEIDNFMADMREQKFDPDVAELKDFVKENVPLGQGKRVIEKYAAIEAKKKAEAERMAADKKASAEKELKRFIEDLSNKSESAALWTAKNLKSEMDKLSAREDKGSDKFKEEMAILKAKYDAIDGDELIELHKNDSAEWQSNYRERIQREIKREVKLNEDLAPRKPNRSNYYDLDL